MVRILLLVTATLLSFSLAKLANGEECSVLLDKANSNNTDLEYNAQWKTLFEKSERLEKTQTGKLYNGLMLKAHNSFYSKVFDNCQAEAKKSGQIIFMAIAVVSKSGTIKQYLTYPRKSEYQCFVKGIVGQSYPPPPEDNYPVGFIALFDDPAGTPYEDCVRKIFGQSIEKIGQSPNKSLNLTGAKNAPPS